MKQAIINDIAHQKVTKAIRIGKLERPNSCDDCGVACIPSGHHDDYSKPLDVKWLCRKCHASTHKQIRSARRSMLTNVIYPKSVVLAKALLDI